MTGVAVGLFAGSVSLRSHIVALRIGRWPPARSVRVQIHRLHVFLLKARSFSIGACVLGQNRTFDKKGGVGAGPFLEKLKRIRKQKKFYFVFPFLPRLTRLLIINLVSIGYVLSLKIHDTCLIFRVRKRSDEVYGKHVIRNICIEKSSEGIRKEKSQQ